MALQNNQASDVQTNFTGYETSIIPPKIDMITANSSYEVEVLFAKPIKPSSVSGDGSDFTITTSDDNAESLEIYSAEVENQYTVLLKTGLQTSSQKYRMVVKNLSSAAGKTINAS